MMGAIIISVDVQINDPNLEESQMDYLINCLLIDSGIPLEPLTQKLRHGSMEREQDGNKIKFKWTGQDWRQ